MTFLPQSGAYQSIPELGSEKRDFCLYLRSSMLKSKTKLVPNPTTDRAKSSGHFFRSSALSFSSVCFFPFCWCWGYLFLVVPFFLTQCLSMYPVLWADHIHVFPRFTLPATFWLLTRLGPFGKEKTVREWGMSICISKGCRFALQSLKTWQWWHPQTRLRALNPPNPWGKGKKRKWRKRRQKTRKNNAKKETNTTMGKPSNPIYWVYTSSLKNFPKPGGWARKHFLVEKRVAFQFWACVARGPFSMELLLNLDALEDIVKDADWITSLWPVRTDPIWNFPMASC